MKEAQTPANSAPNASNLPPLEHDLGAQDAAPSESDRTSAAAPSQRLRQVIKWFVKMALAAACIGWLSYTGRLDLARLRLIVPSPELFFLIVCVIASLVIPAVRWWYLLRAQGIEESLADVIRLTWFGYFASLFLPGAAGGDAAKAVLIVRRQPRDKLRALSTVLIDRYVGLYSVLFVGLIAFVWIIFSGSTPRAVLLIGGMLVGLLVAMTVVPLLVLWTPSRHLVQRWLPARWHALIDDICAEYVASRPTLWLALALSVVSNLFVFAGFLAAARVLQFDVPAAAVFLSGPIITLANTIPLTPGGIGVGEATSEQLLATMNSAGGAEMVMLFRLVTILMTIPAAFLIRFSGKRA